MSSWDFTLLREIWAVKHQQLLFSQLVKSPTERKCFLKKFSKHSKEELSKSSGSWGEVRMTRFFQPSCDCQAQWGVICDQWSWAGESPSPGRITQAFACFPSSSLTKTQVTHSQPSPSPGVLNQFPTPSFPNRGRSKVGLKVFFTLHPGTVLLGSAPIGVPSTQITHRTSVCPGLWGKRSTFHLKVFSCKVQAVRARTREWPCKQEQ